MILTKQLEQSFLYRLTNYHSDTTEKSKPSKIVNLSAPIPGWFWNNTCKSWYFDHFNYLYPHNNVIFDKNSNRLKSLIDSAIIDFRWQISISVVLSFFDSLVEKWLVGSLRGPRMSFFLYFCLFISFLRDISCPGSSLSSLDRSFGCLHSFFCLLFLFPVGCINHMTHMDVLKCRSPVFLAHFQGGRGD